MTNIVSKGDFVELKFTGKSNGVVFDSNDDEELKKMEKKEKPRKAVVIIGQGMVVQGLDRALEGKEIGKDYAIEIKYTEGFGPRLKNLVKTIPLKVFVQHKVNPEIGMSLVIDNALVRVIAVSGARVITDFNHPLAGKDLSYEFKIIKKIDDVKEKAYAFFDSLLGFMPELELVDGKIVAMGQKELEKIVHLVKRRFKELVNAELEFSLKEKEIKKESIQ